jgi:hypothetical protein
MFHRVRASLLPPTFPDPATFDRDIDVALMSPEDMELAAMRDELVAATPGDADINNGYPNDTDLDELPPPPLQPPFLDISATRPSSPATTPTPRLDRRASRVLDFFATQQQQQRRRRSASIGGGGENGEGDTTHVFVSFADLSAGATSASAARTFLQILVLASLDHILVEQPYPYADIHITVTSSSSSM